MIDRSVASLLKRSEMRIRVSCNLHDKMRRCVDRSMKAIVRSRQLLANSEPLLSYGECHQDGNASAAPLTRTDPPATSSLAIVCKRDFGYEYVTADGKHFCNCTFHKCTLLYSGSQVTFESCQFHGCRFEFSGAAGRTLQFLECFGLLTERSPDLSSCEIVDSPLEFVN